MTSRSRKINRRGFLRRSATVGSALAAAPSVLRAASEPAELNVALIGGGDQGQELLKSCLRIAGLRHRAICDLWADFNHERAARIVRKYGHEPVLYTDYRELLEKEKGLDAVIIATPDFCHAEQTVACLEAGLNVYCESPMANSLHGARAMAAAARKTGKLLQIGHQRRSSPPYRHCAGNLLREVKLLGRILTMNAQWNRPVQTARGWPRRAPIAEEVLRAHGYESMDQFRNWTWYRKLGSGPLGALGCHQLDVLNWFFGAYPKAVMATGGVDYYDPKSHQWPDTVLALLDYAGGDGAARASYQLVNTNGNLADYERFLGDEGALIISESAGTASVYREYAALEWDRWVDLGYLVRPGAKSEDGEEKGGGLSVTETIKPSLYLLPVKFKEAYYRPHLENFFDAVRGTGSLTCPPAVAYAACVTAFKINDALTSGDRLFFAPDDFTC